MHQLDEYEKRGYTYQENVGKTNKQVRFSLRRGDDTIVLKAYEIDISSSMDAYFKYHYRDGRGEDKQSVDGLYIGKVRIKNKVISFVIVLELEGTGTPFDEAVMQCDDSIKHFCKDYQNDLLDDDGNRHHRSSQKYSLEKKHLVIALVVGSDNSRKSRLETSYFLYGKRVLRYCFSKRRPDDYTAEKIISILDKAFNFTGETADRLRHRY